MRRRFGDARVARLGTVTADQRPHLVPCCFAVDRNLGGDVIWSAVDAKPKSTLALRRLANIRANPVATLLVDHYSDDWTALWWVRVDGWARVVDEGSERDAALATLVGKYDQYHRSPPPGPVIAIDVTAWTAWP